MCPHQPQRRTRLQNLLRRRLLDPVGVCKLAGQQLVLSVRSGRGARNGASRLRLVGGEGGAFPVCALQPRLLDLLRDAAGEGGDGVAEGQDGERGQLAADDQDEGEGDHAADVVGGAADELEVGAAEVLGLHGCAERCGFAAGGGSGGRGCWGRRDGEVDG